MTKHEFLRDSEWRKSSRSGSGGTGSGNCVEVAFGEHVVAARDSKTSEGSPLVLPAARWSAFLTSLRAGRFDL